jgi:hypothetical protein
MVPTHLVSPAWMVLEYGWYPLLAFVATPYLLHSLGPEKYGHWMLLTAIVGIRSIRSAEIAPPVRQPLGNRPFILDNSG